MSETVEIIIAQELDKLRDDIIRRHEQAGQVATGRTRESFQVRLTGPMSGELTGATYAEVLERGRGPGKVPADFKNILARWATAKGITFSNETDFNRWAYFVSKKIREEGTTLYRSGQTVDVFQSAIEDFAGKIVPRISQFYATEIQRQIHK